MMTTTSILMVLVVELCQERGGCDDRDVAESAEGYRALLTPNDALARVQQQFG